VLDVDTLRRLLRLDHETGRLWWRPREPEWFATRRAFATWNTRYANKEALAAVSGKGYRHGAIFDRTYEAHLVVFALANGRWSDALVDHHDGDKLNNRPGNLRAASHPENMRNRGADVGSTSSFCGVSWDARCRKWRACATIHGAYKHLGRFPDESDAARAYDAFARAHHGAFARLNFPDEERHHAA
jgi:hypothetical protein